MNKNRTIIKPPTIINQSINVTLKLGIYDPNFKQDHCMVSRTHRQIPTFEPAEPLQDIEPFKELYIDTERCKFWLAQGARPTPAVHRIFSFAGILPPPPSRLPQGWDHKKWTANFKGVHNYVKAKTKIEES